MTTFLVAHIVKEVDTLMKAPVLSIILMFMGATVAYFLVRLRYRGAIDSYKGTIETLNARVAFWKERAVTPETPDDDVTGKENNRNEGRKTSAMQAQWLTGVDVMKYYNISHDMLIQHVQKGLPVYPKGRDVLTLGDMVPTLKEEDFAFEVLNEDFRDYRFNSSDIEKHAGKNP